MSAYAQLETRFSQLAALEGASAILHWDSEVMMPSGSVESRGEQLAALAAIQHEKITDPALADLLDQAQDESLDVWQQANLREMRHHVTHSTALPDDLVQALTKATTTSEHRWRDARKHNDYEGFKPIFAEVLALVRESAQTKAEALGLSPYDALLDQYDPGLRSDEVDVYFSELDSFLPDFVQQVIEHQKTRTSTLLDDTIPQAEQEAVCRVFMEKFGFDFTRGRADISTHPFCGGVPGDIRLTSRFDEANMMEGLYATFHETGHALYEMGLPQDWLQQPVGRARGMSMHESQSLLVEMQLCLSAPFIRYALPILKKHLNLGDHWNETALQHHLTRVRPSLIRVTADEVTYPLHVMLRTKLEKALLSGDLSLDDLPAAWDDEMQRLLGIRPDSIANGCLQDTHWPSGAIGYFPTYTLGAMIAAQLMHTARATITNLDTQIERGDFTALFDWLRSNIHQKASLLSTQELLREATGQGLNVSLYKQHLTDRYLS